MGAFLIQVCVRGISIIARHTRSETGKSTTCIRSDERSVTETCLFSFIGDLFEDHIICFLLRNKTITQNCQWESHFSRTSQTR